MLKIQRASAGSGKTFTLARNYILNLIAFLNPQGEWKLRNQRQIEESLVHILAITFTNKATNEMKQRIVNNLSLLSKASKVSSIYPASESIQDIPYLREFHELTGASFQEIGKAADWALKSILNNYSLFKISTIDSFFQEILRTFVYEANINDSYQLEIDSNYITDSAFDTAIHELDIHPSVMGNANFWFRTLIHQQAKVSQKWNPFNKQETSKSVYSNLKKAIIQLESEDFKGIKELLDLYFSFPENKAKLIELYTFLKSNSELERESLLAQIKKSVEKIDNVLKNLAYSPDHIYSKFFTHLEAARILGLKDKFDYKIEEADLKSVFKKKYELKGNVLDPEASFLYKLLNKWKNPSADSFFSLWNLYGELMPYLGLIYELKAFISDALKSNNIIQISDTSFILRKIIGEDDAPFIYERLGNRIDNYLIDEFQDTSKLQWDIIYPLLSESEAKGYNSLIIGDPKQSIYRFRNADHSLITDVVPKAFPLHASAGNTAEENTNWRSLHNIIKFNNYFFKVLASVVSEVSKSHGLPTDFSQLYYNVIQKPNDVSKKGYIEIRFFSKPDQEDIVCDDLVENAENYAKDWFETVSLSNLGPLLSSLLSRGYNAKDIAILVNTNENGKMVVESLVSYNASLSEGDSKIDFLSEESLLVSSSIAVSMIIYVLEKLAQPGLLLDLEETIDTKASSEEETSKLFVDWNKIKAAYNAFSLKHPELSSSECLLAFLQQQESDFFITTVLKSLPTLSLSSIVEAIVKNFIDSSLRKSEALYISSFQDLVNEFSSVHQNAPAYFLEWWHSRGCKAAVAAPEGSDAVQIMTIHKSKGLEFKCVILPFAAESFSPSANKAEWRWVKPSITKKIDFPPFLPVKTKSSLLGSEHELLYKKYFDQVLTDKLNMFYVAFTRARNELYMFTKKPVKGGLAFSDFLRNILLGKVNSSTLFSNEEMEFIISPEDIKISYNEDIISYGDPLNDKDIYQQNQKEKLKDRIENKYFSDYYINSKRPRLQSKAIKLPPSSTI